MKRKGRGFKFDLDMIKNIVRVADKAIEAGEEVSANLKGKSKEEIIAMLKGNLSGLKNPKNLFDLQKALKGKNPKEIKQFLQDNFKDLDAKDVADVAKALSEEKGLSDLLSKKLQPADDQVASEKTDVPAKAETPKAKAPEQGNNTAKPKSNKTIADSPWFKIAGAAMDFKAKSGKPSADNDNQNPEAKTNKPKKGPKGPGQK